MADELKVRCEEPEIFLLSLHEEEFVEGVAVGNGSSQFPGGMVWSNREESDAEPFKRGLAFVEA